MTGTLKSAGAINKNKKETCLFFLFCPGKKLYKKETFLFCSGKRTGSGSLWQEVNLRSLCPSETLVFFQNKRNLTSNVILCPSETSLVNLTSDVFMSCYVQVKNLSASFAKRKTSLQIFSGRHLHTRTLSEWKATTTWLLSFIG